MTTNKKQGGYIALMATIVISLILLVMAVEEGSSGWYARFNILGTEAKEKASALAEGCAEQAIATLLTDPTYTGDATTITTAGTCHIFPIQLNYPVSGLVTIKTQAVVNGSYANLDMAMSMNDIHFGSIPTAPTTGTLFITTHVVNDSSGAKSASDFTVNVASVPPAPAPFAGSESGVAVIVKPGAYSVTQSTFANYQASQTTDCSGTIIAGQIKFCTFTNDDITTTLTLIANIVNDNGGTATPNSIPLFIDGTAVTLGHPVTVTAGPHTVSATTPTSSAFPPPTLYAVSPWGYDCAAAGTITMSLGQNKTCIINFDDPAPPAPSCADTVMILDRTGSMSNTDLTNERSAASSLVNLYAGVLPPATHPQIGVGSIGGLYGNTAAQVPDNTHPIVGWLTTVYSTITSAVTTMTGSNSSVGSDLSAGIVVATNELNSIRHIAGKEKVIILVSDGDPNEPSGNTAYDTGFSSGAGEAQNAAGELWTTPAGAYDDAGGDANDPVSENDRHRLYNFGFGAGAGLPAGVTVTGIEAKVDAWATAPGVAVNTGSLSPTALGTYDQWTSNSGTDVSAVSSNNGDTSYIDTASSVETFAVTNAGLPAGSTINSVTISVVAKGSPANAVMQIVAEKGGTLSVGPNVTVTSSSYNTYTRVMNTDPTGAAWTLAEVNAWTSKFGVRTTNSANIPRVTQVFVTVSYNQAGDTGFISPSNQSSDSGGNGNGFESNPTSAFTDGGGSATNNNNGGDRHRYFNYNINIPNGATVTGIEARPDWWLDSTSGTNSVDMELSWNGGSSWSSKRNESSETTNDTNDKVVGDNNDNWGHTWSVPSDFTNANFRARITMNSSSNSRDFSLDWMPVRIYYTLPSVTTGQLSPTALGTYDQWTSNSGTDVSAVSSNNGDTSYIDTASSVETFAVTNAGLPAGSTINSVTISVVAKGNPANAVMQIVAEKSGTLSVGPNITVTSGSYNTYTRVMNTDPTGAAWTLSEVNAWTSKFGVRTTNSANTPRVTQVFVTVSYNAPGATACQLGVDLSWNGGGSWSNEKTQTLTGTETTYTLGASNDDWTGSHTWSASEFSNANFRARVHAIDPGGSCDNSAVDHLDWMQLKIHYSQNVDPIQAALNAADTAKLADIDIFTIHFGDDAGPYQGKKLLANLANGSTAVTYNSVTHQNGSFADAGGVTTGSSGPISPSSSSIDTGGDGNGFEVTPNNAFVDGPSGTGGAAQNIDGAGDRHRFSGYNFIIPPGATITGIQTRLDWWLDSTSGTNSMNVELSWDAGANWTAAKSDNNESTSVSNSRTLGSTSDTWGHAWTAGELDSSKFRVRVTSNSTSGSRDFYLDWIPVTVNYSVNTENGDGDNFFVAPTSADMQGIFNFIGNQVCPAALNIAATPPPTTGNLIVMTQVTNNNGGTKVESDFTANVSAVNPSQSSFPGSAVGITVTVDPGNYTVTESGIPGYTQSPGAACSSAGSLGPIVAGETRVCVLNNDDIPPPPPPPNLNLDQNTWHEVPTAN